MNEGTDRFGAPPPPAAYSPASDEHLRILSICYWIFAALGALGLLALVCHGLFFVTLIGAMPAVGGPPGAATSGPDPRPLLTGMMSVVYGSIGCFLLAMIVLDVLAARGLARKRSRTTCLVAAGLTCLSFPFGTVLGVFTFVVLSRGDVIAAFEAQASADARGRA